MEIQPINRTPVVIANTAGSVFLFRGYAFKSEHIKFIEPRSVIFYLRGAIEEDLAKFKAELESDALSLASGNAIGQDICAIGYCVYNAILTEVTPSKPLFVNQVAIFKEITLKYTSLNGYPQGF